MCSIYISDSRKFNIKYKLLVEKLELADTGDVLPEKPDCD